MTKIKTIITELEDFVKKCRKNKVQEIYFRITSNKTADERMIMEIQLTAMYLDEYANNLIHTQSQVSPGQIKTEGERKIFMDGFNRTVMGGNVEGKDGQTVPVRGIIPYIQQEFPSAEIIEGWVGW